MVALQGTLETFSLPDVLQLLSSTSKSGCLRLTGDRGSGRVWVSEGAIVSSEAGGAPHADGPVDVLFELLRFDEGEFLFEEGGEPDEAGSPAKVDEVLGSASTMLDEWKKIEAVVPSNDHWVSLAETISGDEVTIPADRWKAVVAVAGGTTVGQLGDTLSLGELPVARLVAELKEQSLIDVSEPPVDLPVSVPAEPVLEAVEETPTIDASADIIEIPEPAVTPDEPAVTPDEAARIDEAPPFDPEGLVIEDTEPLAEAETVPAAPSEAVERGEPAEPGEAAEIARQLANLSPKAARAVAAAAKATTDEEREAALAEVEASDDQINRDLLLKFLGTVN